jgi:hypothetical protein
MELKVGDRVIVESESTERPPRTGVIEEVCVGRPHRAALGSLPWKSSARPNGEPSAHRFADETRSESTPTSHTRRVG